MSDLCCCEYFDNEQERSHILACCCNCVDLDEAFESLIRGETIQQSNKSGLILAMQDRMRIPWRGGAKQIAFDAILPLIILPGMFILASLSLLWTIFSFTTVLIFICVIFNFFIRTLPKTKFFFMWTIASGVLLYCIFEIVVIPLLEILLEENIGLSVLISGFVFSVYVMKNRTNQLGSKFNNGSKSGVTNCGICQIAVPEKDHHCVWLNCCVGRHNQWYFILALLFAIISLLYSSNLTLTSVCHPFIFYKTILLPDDCSDVYQQFELGLSFTSALYSLGVAVLVFQLFLMQLLLVTLGLTTKEWRRLPLSHKFCLGLLAKRPASRGFIGNWSRIMFWNESHYNSVLNQL